MKKITFTCEVISPMFLGNVTQDAELRTLSLKPALRFWWRAMNAHLPIAELKKQETRIFGGGGKTSLGSSFSLKLKQVNGKDFTIKEYNYNNNPIEGVNNYEGVKYFFYTFQYLKKSGSYIKPKSQFQVTFFYREESIVKEVIKSFYLLSMLGSLGSRMRRGAGSFRVVERETENELVNVYEWGSLPNIKMIKGFLVNLTTENNHSLNLYSNIFQDPRIFIANTGKGSWAEALNEIALKMKEIRLNGTQASIGWEESAAFGLLVRHNNGHFTVMPENRDFKRRSSPLYIKIANVQEDDTEKYYWVMTYFKGYFLPENGIIKKTDNNEQKAVNPNKLYRFIKEIKTIAQP